MMTAILIALGIFALLASIFIWCAIRLGSACDRDHDEAMRLEALANELREQDDAAALEQQASAARAATARFLGDADGIIDPARFSPEALAAAEICGRPPILNWRQIQQWFQDNHWLGVGGSSNYQYHRRLFGRPDGRFQEARISGPRPYWRYQIGWMSGTETWQPIHAPKRFDTLDDLAALAAQTSEKSCPPPPQVAA